MNSDDDIPKNDELYLGWCDDLFAQYSSPCEMPSASDDLIYFMGPWCEEEPPCNIQSHNEPPKPPYLNVPECQSSPLEAQKGMVCHIPPENALEEVETTESAQFLTRRDIYGHGIEAKKQRQFGAPGMWKTDETYLELKRVGCGRKENLLQLLRHIRKPGDKTRDNERSMNGLIAYLKEIPIAELLLAWEELNTTMQLRSSEVQPTSPECGSDFVGTCTQIGSDLDDNAVDLPEFWL